MPDINNQNVLNRIEDHFLDTDPENVDEAVSIASDFLYGTNQVPGVSSDKTQDVTTLADYETYADKICQDPHVASFYYGDHQSETVFFETRELLEIILQEKWQQTLPGMTQLWGDCSRDTVDDQHKPRPIDFSLKEQKRPNLTFFTFSLPKPEKPKAKPAPPPSPPKKAPGTICVEMGITRGGAYLLHAEKGFYCEFNYTDEHLNTSNSIYINEFGEEEKPNVYRMHYIPHKYEDPPPPPKEPVVKSAETASSVEQTSSAETPNLNWNKGKDTQTNMSLPPAGPPNPFIQTSND